MKITIESKNKEVKFNPAELFQYPDSTIKELQKPKKTSIEWREPINYRKTFVNDQIITDADPNNGNWLITYHMAKSLLSEFVYRVRMSNQEFIAEAITTGVADGYWNGVMNSQIRPQDAKTAVRTEKRPCCRGWTRSPDMAEHNKNHQVIIDENGDIFHVWGATALYETPRGRHWRRQ